MKTRSSKYVLLLSVLCWAAWSLGPRAVAEAPAELALQLYAGLTITGAVGTVYSVEYITDLAQTNNASVWRCLDFLQLPASPYFWADKYAPATGQRFYRAVDIAVPRNLAFIPPGTFRIGSPTNEVDRYDWNGPYDREGLQTSVTISRGFWMGKYEVTQAEYLAVMGENPSFFSADRIGIPENLSRPVEAVLWEDATNYCGKLTHRERVAGRIPTNSVYRLPTEAEWEYACRAWTSTRFSYGDDAGYTNLTNYAWYSYNSKVDEYDSYFYGGHMTHSVGQKLANPWGLYDMHGNVWEWCQDWFGPYPGGIALDPQGPATGSRHVFRGGDWHDGPMNCRSAARDDTVSYPLSGGRVIGFRVLLAPGQP